jgi:hypothetical protein
MGEEMEPPRGGAAKRTAAYLGTGFEPLSSKGNDHSGYAVGRATNGLCMH